MWHSRTSQHDSLYFFLDDLTSLPVKRKLYKVEDSVVEFNNKNNVDIRGEVERF